MEDQRMAYIGRCGGCNAVIAATVDEQKHRKDVAKAVSEWIRDGMTVEHVNVSEVGQLWGDCTCRKTKKAAGQAALPGME
jgi:hypothetical protein